MPFSRMNEYTTTYIVFGFHLSTNAPGFKRDHALQSRCSLTLFSFLLFVFFGCVKYYHFTRSKARTDRCPLQVLNIKLKILRFDALLLAIAPTVLTYEMVRAFILKHIKAKKFETVQQITLHPLV